MRPSNEPTQSLYQVELWLPVAIATVVAFTALFWILPSVVEGMLRPHATLHYRDRKDRVSSGGRYVTFCHAIMISYLNFYLVFGNKLYAGDGPAKGEMELLYPASTAANISLGISLGYFAFDAAIVYWYLPAIGGVEMVIHHICAFFSVLTTVYHQSCQLYTLLLLATEITTPFINFRWLLEKMQWKQSRLYKANGLGLLISWILARIILYIYIFAKLYSQRDQIPYIPRLVSVPLLVSPPIIAVLNLIWFNKILKGFIKVFSGRAQGTKGQRMENGGSKVNGQVKLNAKAN